MGMPYMIFEVSCFERWTSANVIIKEPTKLGVGGGGFLDREMPKMSVKDQLSEQRTGERPFLTKET